MSKAGPIDRVPDRDVPLQGLAGPADVPNRMLSPEGEALEGFECHLEPEELRAALRWMLFSRQFDEKAFSLQRQGRFGTYSPMRGQEAAVVGSSTALDPSRDWVAPSYRELTAMLRQGLPLTQFMLYFTGKPEGGRVPDGVNLLPIQISLASQLPHAVGLAWGLRSQGLDGVVLAYCGDGASSEGDFHEALNLAGVRRAPVVFLLQNNQWAISTPRHKQTAAATFAGRAAGYGMPGELVDGNDFFAVHDATRRAVARARAGEGPTLIEAFTYRLWAHNTADDATRYQTDEELATAVALDPLPRLRAYLATRGLVDPATEETWSTEIANEINEVVKDIESRSQPSPLEIFDHVYTDEPERLSRQRREMAERLGIEGSDRG